MAKAADNANKKAKPSLGTRFVNFFKGIGKSFKNMYHELKKVTWPTKKELLNYSVAVFAFLVVMGIIIGLIDAGSGLLINWIVKL